MMTEENIIDPNITSDDKLWALLSYIFTPIIPIVLLLIEDKKNRPFLKAHYPQALAFGIVAWVISGVALTCILFRSVSFGQPHLCSRIIWAIKAYNGEYVNIPVITDFVKKQGWAD
jgi:uncharacterized protein